MAGQWAHVPAAWRFCGGRRRHNAERRLAADERRHLVLLLTRGGMRQRDAARVLGVHEGTISRDVALLGVFRYPAHVCRHCGVPLARLALQPWPRDPEGLTPAGQQLLGIVHQALGECAAA